jgi:NTP pyrophosphatase (non-canonical NTP hydrolase)
MSTKLWVGDKMYVVDEEVREYIDTLETDIAAKDKRIAELERTLKSLLKKCGCKTDETAVMIVQKYARQESAQSNLIKDLQTQLTECDWVSKIDPAVIAITKTMQFKLDKNQHKECDIMNPDGKGRHWRHCNTKWLLGRIREETIELEDAVDLNEGIEAIKKECADIANFAMMIHDNITLPPTDKPKAEGIGE